MKFLICGDLVPTKNNMFYFENGSVKELIGNKLFDIWFDANFRIFNLEAPILDTPSPIRKCGPNLRIPSRAFFGIKELKPSLINLANNHILDHGNQGLEKTCKILEENGISYVGAGKNIEEAQKPFIFRQDEVKVGVYSCCDHEFSCAMFDKPGSNPFDSYKSMEHVKNLKTICDYVIVLYHGGKEYYRYPSPWLQKICRQLVINGADLVVCQHSHTIGCFENFHNKKIVYGQGNFIFNNRVNEHWNSSIIIETEVHVGNINVNYLPLQTNEIGIELAETSNSSKILADLMKRSSDILEENFLLDEFQNYASKMLPSYLRVVYQQNKAIRMIDKMFFQDRIIKYTVKQKTLLSLLNFIECEAHREMIITSLRRELFK